MRLVHRDPYDEDAHLELVRCSARAAGTARRSGATARTPSGCASWASPRPRAGAATRTDRPAGRRGVGGLRPAAAGPGPRGACGGCWRAAPALVHGVRAAHGRPRSVAPHRRPRRSLDRPPGERPPRTVSAAAGCGGPTVAGGGQRPSAAPHRRTAPGRIGRVVGVVEPVAIRMAPGLDSRSAACAPPGRTGRPRRPRDPHRQPGELTGPGRHVERAHSSALSNAPALTARASS